MYLLVFTTLVIGLLSVYAQILSLQAAQIASMQTGLARNMLVWHGAAVSMAAELTNASPPTASLVFPCSLSYNSPNAGVAKCVKPTNAISTGTPGSPTGTVTDNAATPKISYLNGTEKAHLPADYTTALYQFYSVLYQDPTNSSPFVVTFVWPPVLSTTNPAPGLISLPLLSGTTGRMTSFSMGDLSRQMKLIGLPFNSYGTVISGKLVTASSEFQYTMPPAVAGNPVVKDGSLAIISSPQGY